VVPALAAEHAQRRRLCNGIVHGFAMTCVAATALFLFIEKPFSLQPNMRTMKLWRSEDKP
jgi:hypothetical protein